MSGQGARRNRQGGAKDSEATADDDDADAPEGSTTESDAGREVLTDGAAADPDPAATELTYDTVFDLLSNARRRFTLRYLREHGSTSRGELAEEIAAIENDKPRAEVTSQERKRIDVSLYQCHLPRLEDSGVVDSDRGIEVALGPNADQLFEYLETESGGEHRLHPAYPAATAAGIIGIGVWFLPGWGPLVGPVLVSLALLGVLLVACAEVLGRHDGG